MEIMSTYLLRGLTQQQQKAAPALFWIKSALSGFCSTYIVLNSLDLKSCFFAEQPAND